ncbi:hypothetical protein [Bartonella sp. CB178]|uniref:hypothetical protein n=1 Tax=Bartonella sp. CB178 TaxID=3112255 RepID=UPI00300E0C34
MLKSLFSFVRRKALSFDPKKKMMIRGTIARALKLKRQRAAIYLRYAQALAPYYPGQTAIFKEMGIQELKGYEKFFDLSRSHFANTTVALRNQSSFVRKKCSLTPARATATARRDRKKLSQADRQTLLTWIQPGLAGLMDGSVSTLAPIFAAAFATGDTHKTFLIGLSASIGAGLSMGFTEATHDDGKLSGRGSPIKRGIACGVMTTLGGLGHTLPYLINSFYLATIVAFITVFCELGAIVWIQNKFMATPFWRASLQVIVGGALVFATSIIIGSV